MGASASGCQHRRVPFYRLNRGSGHELLANCAGAALRLRDELRDGDRQAFELRAGCALSQAAAHVWIPARVDPYNPTASVTGPNTESNPAGPTTTPANVTRCPSSGPTFSGGTCRPGVA